jgi:hypothetical protein
MKTVFYPPHLGIKAREPNATASPTWLYWIDPSCDEVSKGDFEACLFEARYWAKRAYERLTSETDTDFARIFHILFKVPITDDFRYPMSHLWQSVHGRHPQTQWRTSAEQVLGVLHNFAHCWRRTHDRQEADVRLYATDLAHSRWLPYGPDGAIDPVNHLVSTETPAEMAEDNTATAVCDGKWLPVEGENPRRTTIEMSPSLWIPLERTPPEKAPGFLTLRGMDPSVLLGGHDANGVEGADRVDDGVDKQVHAPRLLTSWKLAEDLIPCLLFHEFMHIYLLTDFANSDDGRTSGWRLCMLRERGEAPVCAESLAMLGLWAALADMRPADKPSGGFSLHRWWRETPGMPYDVDGRAIADDKTIYEPSLEYVLSAVRGEVIFYEDLTS